LELLVLFIPPGVIDIAQKNQNQVLPEELLSNEIKLVYKMCKYGRTPIHELISQYLIILNRPKSLYFERGENIVAQIIEYTEN
jgi:hypothetical protein